MDGGLGQERSDVGQPGGSRGNGPALRNCVQRREQPGTALRVRGVQWHLPVPRSGQDGFGCVSRDPGEYTDSSGSPHAPLARNYTACRLVSLIGPRVSELCLMWMGDLRWELGPFGKVLLRGKGSRGCGKKERLVPLINGAKDLLEWVGRVHGRGGSSTTG